MIKPGIVVAGTNIGCTLHLPALRAAGFDIRALVGRDLSRTREVAARHAVAEAHISLDAALDSDVAAVVVATPPETHHALAMKAIAAGKHVLCEKPFALDVGQAREMRDAAREMGVVGQLVHQLRWFGFAQAVRKVASSKAIGALLQGSFQFDHCLAARGLRGMPDWWTDGMRGGGWLHNYASHGIDLLRYMIGEFEAVAATLHRDVGRSMTSDDGYAFVFTMTNGMQGVMSGSCRAWDTCDRSRLMAEQATLDFDSQCVVVTDAAGTRNVWPVENALVAAVPEGTDCGDAHTSDYGSAEQAALARSFLMRIRDTAYCHPSVATFDDGVAHMEVIAAILAGSRTNRWVAIR